MGSGSVKDRTFDYNTNIDADISRNVSDNVTDENRSPSSGNETVHPVSRSWKDIQPSSQVIMRPSMENLRSKRKAISGKVSGLKQPRRSSPNK